MKNANFISSPARMLITAFLLLLPFTVAVMQPVHAQSSKESICTGAGGTFDANANGGQGACTSGGQTVQGTFSKIANILIFLVGAISVLMVIVGGLRYTLSGGDSSGINSAKNTILYAIIGIVIAAAAYGIVNFVLKSFNIQ